jgi:hypothetical protein
MEKEQLAEEYAKAFHGDVKGCAVTDFIAGYNAATTRNEAIASELVEQMKERIKDLKNSYDPLSHRVQIDFLQSLITKAEQLTSGSTIPG